MQRPSSKKLYPIPPPPHEIYATCELGEAALHAWGLRHGCNYTRKDLTYDDDTGELVERFFACDRAGQLQNNRKLTQSERKRPMSASKKCGCPMRIKIRRVRDGWEIAYTRDGSTLHNHRPTKDIRVHVGHRQRAARRAVIEARRHHGQETLLPSTTGVSTREPVQRDVWRTVDSQSAAGVSNAQIYAGMLMSGDGDLVVPRDISNRRAANRLRLLATQTSIEALFELLRSNGFYFKFETDPATHRLRYLFWAHPMAIHYYREWPDVVIADSTYKTNRHKMPLLNVVAVSGLNSVIPVAQCWLPGENEANFVWALSILRQLQQENGVAPPRVLLSDRDLAYLNAERGVFPGVPRIVCRWHMRRNVLAKAQKHLGKVRVVNPGPLEAKWRNSDKTDAFMAKFDQAVDSLTADIFEHRCAELKTMSLVVSAYLDRHWWPYKHMVVRAWTDKYTHFGHYDTSLVEGTHAKMKRWIHNSRGDLLTVFQQLFPWWLTALDKLKFRVSYELTYAPFLLRTDTFSAVVRVISVWALTATHELWKRALTEYRSGVGRQHCSGRFRQVHGRPCVHELRILIESHDTIKLLPEHFDGHWWIDVAADDNAGDRVQEPMTRQFAFQPRRTHCTHDTNNGLHNTRREPSGFEHDDYQNDNQWSQTQGADMDDEIDYDDLTPAHGSSDEIDIAYFDNVLHPRSWGDAGRTEW